MTPPLPLRTGSPDGPDGHRDRLGGGFAGAFLLHAGLAALILGWAWLFHTSGKNWGDANAGSIPATMVNDIPLPPRQPRNEDNVLATETPTPAPITAPKTVEAVKPNAVAIPVKPTRPVPIAEKTTPPPPLHPQPIKPDPTKAQTGEATGVRIAMSADQTRLGTFSVGVADAAFGSRYAYYIAQIKQKVEAQYYTGMIDGQAAGHHVSITFQIARDGSPSHITVDQPSGDASLDQTAMRALQHIDTFGPLPDGYSGSMVNVLYRFEPPPRP
jgi:protein TonB